MKKVGNKKNFHFGIFEVKKWEKWVCCVAATPRSFARCARYSCQSPVASKPRSIAGRAELAWYTLSRALITGGNAALTPGCILDALSGLTRERDLMRPRSQNAGNKGRKRQRD